MAFLYAPPTPTGVNGQMAINSAIGVAQAALNGGSVKVVAVGVGTGALAGKLGGKAYKATLHFLESTLYKRCYICC